MTSHQLLEPFAVCLLVVDQEKVLGVTRKQDHSDWGLPGGKIDPGETPLVACCRELQEETGLLVADPLRVIPLYDGLCLSPVTQKYRRVITYWTPRDNLVGEVTSSDGSDHLKARRFDHES